MAIISLKVKYSRNIRGQKAFMNSIKTYTVYAKPGQAKQPENAIFVPETFTLAALIPVYNFVWAVMNKCWLFLVILLVFNLTAVPQSFNNNPFFNNLGWIKLAIFPFLGVFANDFWRQSLKRRGYQLQTVVSGKNESEAQLRYFERVSGN